MVPLHFLPDLLAFSVFPSSLSGRTALEQYKSVYLRVQHWEPLALCLSCQIGKLYLQARSRHHITTQVSRVVSTFTFGRWRKDRMGWDEIEQLAEIR